MKYLLILLMFDMMAFTLGLVLWFDLPTPLDDLYPPDDKKLVSAYGLILMKISFLFGCLDALLSLFL